MGVTLVIGSVMWAGMPAYGQTALGDGRLLEANLSVDTRYNTPKPSFLLNRINNAIVNGNAPGGKSFRGDVGYSSEFAFRGNAAGSSFFNFDRDSYFSGLHYNRYSSMQITGERPGAGQGSPYARSPFYSTASILRSPGGGASLAQIAQTRYGTGIPEYSAASTLSNVRNLPSPFDLHHLDLSPAARVGTMDYSVGGRSLLSAPLSADPFLDRSNQINASLMNHLLLQTPGFGEAGAGGELSPGRADLQSRLPAVGGVPDLDNALLSSGVPLVVTNSLNSTGIVSTIDGRRFSVGWASRIDTAGGIGGSGSVTPGQSPSPQQTTVDERLNRTNARDFRLRQGQDRYTDYVSQLAAQNTSFSTNPPFGSQPQQTDASGSGVNAGVGAGGTAKAPEYSDAQLESIRKLAEQWKRAIPGSALDDTNTPPGGDLSMFGGPASPGPRAPGSIGTSTPNSANSAPVPSTPGSIPPDLLAKLRTNLPPVTHLAGDTASRCDEQMAKGEKALAEGRYFDADQWFDLALRFSPGHPFALAGRLNALLGAGMYRSATMIARSLMQHHPELINVQYAPSLLPAADRMQAVINELNAMLEHPMPAVEPGLLLAYIGHQLHQPDLISRGLDHLAAQHPGDSLEPLLRSIWMPADATPAASAPGGAPTAPPGH